MMINMTNLDLKSLAPGKEQIALIYLVQNRRSVTKNSNGKSDIHNIDPATPRKYKASASYPNPQHKPTSLQRCNENPHGCLRRRTKVFSQR